MFFASKEFIWLKNITNFYTQDQFQGQTWLSTRRAFPSVIMEANRSISLSGHLPDRKAKGSGNKVNCILPVCCSTSTHNTCSHPQTYVYSDEVQWWGRQERRPNRYRRRVMECCRTRGWWESGGYVGLIPKTRKKWSLSLREPLGQHCTETLILAENM